MPGKNATGTKTASSTSDDATTALWTSRIASAALSTPLCLPLFISHVARDVLDDDDRVVDHETGRERQAEERDRIDREPEELHHEERADQRDRDRRRRNQRRPRILQEEEDDQITSTIDEQQRDDDFLDRFVDEGRDCRTRPS